jgi:hypothetical protein
MSISITVNDKSVNITISNSGCNLSIHIAIDNSKIDTDISTSEPVVSVSPTPDPHTDDMRAPIDILFDAPFGHIDKVILLDPCASKNWDNESYFNCERTIYSDMSDRNCNYNLRLFEPYVLKSIIPKFCYGCYREK